MKIKPKKVLLNLPFVHDFCDYHDIPIFADNINLLISSESKIRHRELGCLDGRYIGVFYLKKDKDYDKLCQEYKTMINEAEEKLDQI